MSVKQISVTEIKSMLEEGASLKIIDVRSPEEFSEGHVQGVALMPLPQISEDSIKALSLSPDEPLYFICRSGRRSDHAAQIFKEMGYSHSHNIIGGVLDWSAKGYEMVQGMSDEDVLV